MKSHYTEIECLPECDEQHAEDCPTKIVFGRLICNCQRCPNVWVAETMERPKRCGACKSVLWDREPEKRGPKRKKAK